jgi:hypothetical protein
MPTLSGASGWCERLDLHNVAVDEVLAADGRCATLDLHSGRICVLAFRHVGPCLFVPRDAAMGRS